MNRARRLRRWLRQPSGYTRGGVLLLILLLGSSHYVGAFLVRYQAEVGPALQWTIGTLVLMMLSWGGWLYWRSRQH